MLIVKHSEVTIELYVTLLQRGERNDSPGTCTDQLLVRAPSAMGRHRVDNNGACFIMIPHAASTTAASAASATSGMPPA